MAVPAGCKLHVSENLKNLKEVLWHVISVPFAGSAGARA